MANFFDQFDSTMAAASAAAPAGGNFFDQFDNSPSGVAADLAKSAGIGTVKGALGLAGALGDARGAMDNLGTWIGDKLGLPPAKPNVGATPFGLPNISPPTSAQIRSGVESLTGPLYEPKTTAGHYAETVGEFAPAALAGPGGIGRKLVTQAAIPGIASEAAGQATKGTEAEPYARLAGGLAGGGIGAAADAMAARRAVSNATTSIGDVLSSANADYKSPALDVTFKPKVVETLSNAILKDLDRSKLNERIAGGTRSIVEDLKNPINGTGHTLEDLRTTRTLLGDLAGQLENGRPTQEARAATQAKKLIDRYIASAPQSHLAAGDIGLAASTLKRADADYASAMTAQRVADKLRNAEIQAGSTYSGGNLNNATRQKLRPLLTSKSQGRGLTPDELQQVEETVMGSRTGNALRAAGKLLGGGGGMHMFNAGAIGGFATGSPLGAVAAPLVGYGVKKAGDAITRSNANKIVEQILSRSPTGMAVAAQVPPPERLALLKRMLLASTPSSIPFRAVPQFSNAQN